MSVVNAGICGLLEIGPEKTEVIKSASGSDSEVNGCGFRAFSGTFFNPENSSHWLDSDALRYAIGIQMARDRQEYVRADVIREKIAHSYRVEQGPGHTTLYAHPPAPGSITLIVAVEP